MRLFDFQRRHDGFQISLVGVNQPASRYTAAPTVPDKDDEVSLSLYALAPHSFPPHSEIAKRIESGGERAQC